MRTISKTRKIKLDPLLNLTKYRSHQEDSEVDGLQRMVESQRERKKRMCNIQALLYVDDFQIRKKCISDVSGVLEVDVFSFFLGLNEKD